MEFLESSLGIPEIIPWKLLEELLENSREILPGIPEKIYSRISGKLIHEFLDNYSRNSQETLFGIPAEIPEKLLWELPKNLSMYSREISPGSPEKFLQVF